MNEKELEEKLKEQEELGYPDFKNAIVQELIFKHNVDLDIARRTLSKSTIHEMIEEDIEWSEHMGPNYWAKLIIEQDLLHKT